MSFVLDTSVTMAWCFGDEADALTSAVLERCREESALVPSLWVLEVTNVLLAGERRQRIDRAGSARFLALLRDLPIDVDLTSPLEGADDLLNLSSRNGLSAYDAAYLQLAMLRDLPMATKDARLAKAARTEGVRLLQPME